MLNAVAKVEAATNTKKTLQGAKDANSSEVGPNTKKSADAVCYYQLLKSSSILVLFH